MTALTDRIGVIEVGSRAVRVLVADVSDLGVQEVWANHVSWNPPTTGAAAQVVEALVYLTAFVRGFDQEARARGAQSVFAFGTAALRLDATFASAVADRLPSLTILSAEQEAGFSAIAAASAAATGETAGSLLIIDQGGRSLEVSVTRCPVVMTRIATVSFDLVPLHSDYDSLIEGFG